jgi:uncharacterized protein (DUF433 family)
MTLPFLRLYSGNAESDPEIRGGTPVFTGTRVPVENLISYLKDSESIDEFMVGFPAVKREQVIASLKPVRKSSLRPPKV